MKRPAESANQGHISLVAAGDVIVNRENPDSIFALAARPLQEADIAFCHLEASISRRGALQAGAGGSWRPSHENVTPTHVDPDNIRAFVFAGFDVVSVAGNHSMDWGADAFLDTIDLLRQNGIVPIGVGRDIIEARQPAIIDRRGTSVAFLAYNSILPHGYAAALKKPGCAPLRARTFYEQTEYEQPGTPPSIFTQTYKEDLEAMKADIRKARRLADVVVVSMHWGLHFIPEKLAMYQVESGHAAIEAGADLILGHHPHLIKGIEMYKGKAIFYSLGNFAMDIPGTLDIFKSPEQKARMAVYNWRIDPDYPGYAFPPDSRKTILAKIAIADKKIQQVSFLPALINKQAQPELLPPGDKRRDEVFEYMREMCEALGTKLSFSGEEVVVS